MNKTIQAKNDYVIIRVERESKGITLLKTEQYQEKEDWLTKSPAIAHAVGPDVKGIKVGDRVIVGAVRAARYDYLTDVLGDKSPENTTYLACQEKDIVALINED